MNRWDQQVYTALQNQNRITAHLKSLLVFHGSSVYPLVCSSTHGWNSENQCPGTICYHNGYFCTAMLRQAALTTIFEKYWCLQAAYLFHVRNFRPKLSGPTSQQTRYIALPNFVIMLGHRLLSQQTRGIHPMLFQCWPTVFYAGPIPTNTGHSLNVVSMLAHRLRRWPNIETALGECPVFPGMLAQH